MGRMRFITVLLAALLVLGSALPALAQDDAITLVPFTDEAFGLEGLVPEGWGMAAPGVYARSLGMSDVTSVIVQAAPGMTVEALTSLLLGQLGIDALPASSGTVETEAYSWALYVIDVDLEGMSIVVDLALAEDETGVTLVLLQTQKDEYPTLHEAVFVPVVQALAPIAAAYEGDKSTFVDPAGKFSFPIPTNWDAEQREGYTYLYSPGELIHMSIVVIETTDPEQALKDAWAIVDPNFDKTVEETLELPASRHDRFLLYSYEMRDGEDFIVQAEVRMYQEQAYVFLIYANLIEAGQRQAQIQIVDSGFTITAMDKTDLSTVEPLPLSDELVAELESFIQEAMVTYQTPGAAVAIVRDGEVVYARGFGVRNPQGDPVTPETRMMIGSTTKTMTTLLMAQMVDEGMMDWSTPVTEILPTFAVAEPDVTQALTMEHLVCACTGVPRRDLELVFNSNELTAEKMIESLSTFEFFTDFGETFQYSNQMVAAAGYLTALAAGGEYGTLYEDYVNLLEERIFAPLGMESTTFSFEEVLASDNYSIPYGLYIDFSFQPVTFDVEKSFLIPITPAGAAWSTVLDMADYMLMELNKGVSPDGTRIVSEENLEHTWQPQVAISATDDYGLGWIVSDFYGLQMLSHAGNTLGFSSEFAFLPEHQLGIVVLTNQRISLLNGAIVSRLAEMLFDLPPTSESEQQFAFNMLQEQYAEIGKSIEQVVDADIAALVVGTFTNDALGRVTIRLNEEGVLVFDADEFQSELWRYTGDDLPGDEDAIGLILYDPPINGVVLRFETDENGVYRMIFGEGVTEYAFERME